MKKKKSKIMFALLLVSLMVISMGNALASSQQTTIKDLEGVSHLLHKG